jgi:hypothetical protein
MAWVVFDTFMEKQHDGNAVNLDTGGDDVRVMLVDDTRAPVQATDTNMATIDNNQVTGTNYTAGGADCANQVCALSGGTVTFDFDDITWSQSGAGFSDARYAVCYIYTGTPANDTPICYADLGGDVGNVSGDLVLEMNAAGVIAITNS